MADISKIQLPNGTVCNIKSYKTMSIPMGSVDSTSTSTAFTATVDGINELIDGVCIWLTNGVVTSAAEYTININGLGAKPVYISKAAATASTTQFNLAYTVLLIYNSSRVSGGCWDYVYGYDADTTYSLPKLGCGYTTCSTATATAAKTASLSNYVLTTGGIVCVKFTNDVNADATLNINSKGAKNIYYQGAKITDGIIKANDTAVMVYSSAYHIIAIDRALKSFSNIKVNSTTITADTPQDTLELVAGTNITLTPDANNDKVTINADLSAYAPLASPTFTGTPKAPTATAGTNTTQIATTAFVQTAIDNLPEPMVFKGSLGTGGTITALPVDGSATIGDTYKVIENGTYADKEAKKGDTFICLTKTSSANTWELIPSGDEPSGTVTSVTIKATSPINIDNSSAITDSGTRTLSHANSGVNEGTYRSVTVNATGHVTAGTNPTTLSEYGITDAKIASGTITLGSNTITPITSVIDKDETLAWGEEKTIATVGNTDIHLTMPAKPTYSANNGVGLSGTTFYNSGVRAVSTGSANGTISVNTNGTSANVAVKGLGTAAYKASSDFAVNQTLANDTNLNNITTPGFYNCGGTNSVTNKPSNVDAFGLTVIHDASGQWYTQILYPNNSSPLVYVRNYNSSTWSGWNSIAIGSFLPLAGGTMTGTLTAKASQYADAYSGALNMNNSNIYGLNAIYTADVADNAAEGIHFYRDSTHVDTLWMNEGSLLFVPNRELGAATTAANSQKVARFTANPTTGQVVVTDGTTGGIKSSGYTIATSVPSGALFTDQKVRQSATTTEDFRPILMGATHVSGSSTGLDATVTDEAYVSTKLYCQPNTGNLYIAGDIKRANNTLSLWSGNDCAGVSQRNNYDINTWYGFSVSNACTTAGTLNKVAFSINARNGQAWHTGNVHLYSASGDSPALVFQRGTFVDNLNDWKIYVSGGELRFAQSTANASSETWTNKMYFHSSDGNLYVGSKKVSLEGHTHSNYLGTKSDGTYYGMASPTGADNVWIRTTSQGIIPYQAGGAGSGHNCLGTSSWYFAHAYIDTVHGSLDGTASQAIKLRSSAARTDSTVDTANTTPYQKYWVKIASCYTTGNYTDLESLWAVNDVYGTRQGILKVRARVDGTAGTFGNTRTIRWLVADSSIDVNRFAIVCYNNRKPDGTTASGTATVELWWKSDGQYQSFSFVLLDETRRTGKQPNDWVLYDTSTYGQAALPTTGNITYSVPATILNSTTGNATSADALNLTHGNELNFSKLASTGHVWLGYRWNTQGTETSGGTTITTYKFGNANGTGGLAGLEAATSTFKSGNFGDQLIVERTGGANMAAITFKNTSGVLGYIAANTVDGNLYHYGATNTSTMQYVILDSHNCSDYTFKVTRGSSKSTATSGYWAAMCNSTQTGSPVLPTAGKWWHVISMDWTNDVKNWMSQLAIATQDGSGVWWRRNDTGGTSIDSYSWHRLAEGNSSGAATNVATEVGSSAGARPVFYAYLGDNTRVVYNTNFTYNPSGNVLTVGAINASGQIKTSFKNSVAMGSYAATSSTIDALCTELRYSSGAMGSVAIGTAYTKNNITIAATWYNYIWIPHRTGGVDGSASGDNCNYGTLILSAMNSTTNTYILRFSSSAVAELTKVSTTAYVDNIVGNINSVLESVL